TANIERVPHTLSRRRKFDCRSYRRETEPVVEILALIDCNRTGPERSGRWRVRMLRRAETCPTDAAGKAKPIEPFRIVIGGARTQDGGLPRCQRQLATIKLFQNGLQSFGTFDAMLRINALPGKKKSIKILRRNGLNLCAQPIDREPVNPRKQTAVAPFLFRRVSMKFPAENKAFAFERQQRAIDFRSR